MDVKPLLNKVTSGKNPSGAKSWTCKHCDNKFRSTHTRIHAHFLGSQLGKMSDIARCKDVLNNHEELDKIGRKVQYAQVKSDFLFISFVIILIWSNYFLCYYIFFLIIILIFCIHLLFLRYCFFFQNFYVDEETILIHNETNPRCVQNYG